MSGAPYTVNASFSDDETLVLGFQLLAADSTPLPTADLLFEYAVDGNTVATQAGGGIVVTALTAAMVITVAMGTFDPGGYSHGCRFKSISTGTYTQLFDGTLTITEGEF